MGFPIVRVIVFLDNANFNISEHDKARSQCHNNSLIAITFVVNAMTYSIVHHPVTSYLK
jgi:hypothetical protein